MKTYKNFDQIWEELERSESFEAEKKVLEFTTKLYRLMEERGVTKKELARRLNTSQAYVTKIFRGDANFTVHTMTRLVRALDGELHIQVTPREQKVSAWFGVINGGKQESRVEPEWRNNVLTENVTSGSDRLLNVA